jgi:hypothetical protein
MSMACLCKSYDMEALLKGRRGDHLFSIGRSVAASSCPSPRRGEGQDEWVRDLQNSLQRPNPLTPTLSPPGRGSADALAWRERPRALCELAAKSDKARDSYMALRDKISAWSSISLQPVLEATVRIGDKLFSFRNHRKVVK